MLCEETEKRFCAPTQGPPSVPKKVFIITGTVLSAIVLLLSVIIVELICYKRGRAGYQTIN